MKVYWVNNDDDGTSYTNSVTLYATEELAQVEANRIIERKRLAWQKEEDWKAKERDVIAKGRALLTEAGLSATFNYVPGPREFKPYVYVEYIDVEVE